MPLIDKTADTISEESAAPQQVDEPDRSIVRELPAETTEAPGVEDTGYIWDQTYPGDDQGPPPAKRPRLMAARVTDVSDQILFGSAALTPGTLPFILVPAHRDRLRVTVQVSSAGVDDLAVYLGHKPDVTPGFSAWEFETTDPLVFDTRDVIYVAVGASGEPVRIQWAVELVAEGCGCE